MNVGALETWDGSCPWLIPHVLLHAPAHSVTARARPVPTLRPSALTPPPPPQPFIHPIHSLTRSLTHARTSSSLHRYPRQPLFAGAPSEHHHLTLFLPPLFSHPPRSLSSSASTPLPHQQHHCLRPSPPPTGPASLATRCFFQAIPLAQTRFRTAIHTSPLASA